MYWSREPKLYSTPTGERTSLFTSDKSDPLGIHGEGIWLCMKDRTGQYMSKEEDVNLGVLGPK